MIIVLDLNAFVNCDHIEISHFQKGEFKSTIMGKLLILFEQFKRVFIYFPERHSELIEHLSDRKYGQSLPDDAVLISLTIIKPKSYNRTNIKCEDISGFCEKDYKRICSAIIDYLNQQLIVITCLDSTFSRDYLEGLLREEQIKDRCILEELVSTGGSASVYSIICNLKSDKEKEEIIMKLKNSFNDD